MNGFLVAIQFLTRLPVSRSMDPTQLGPSAAWYPVVGGLLGLIVAVVDRGLASILSAEVRAVVAVLLFIGLSGALHLDGLMDACDGLLAFTSPERRLEIMRDSRVGSFAIAGAATVLLLEYAAFLSLPEPHRFLAFVLVGSLSRWAMVYAAWRYPSARNEGLAYAFRMRLRGRHLAIASAFAVAIALAAGPTGVGALVVAWLVTVTLARYTQSKIPGLTGDILGAICEIVAVAVAVSLPVLGRFFAPM